MLSFKREDQGSTQEVRVIEHDNHLRIQFHIFVSGAVLSYVPCQGYLPMLPDMDEVAVVVDCVIDTGGVEPDAEGVVETCGLDSSSKAFFMAFNRGNSP